VVIRITHRSGAMEPLTDVSRLALLLDELDEGGDAEHPDVAVADPTGWTLSAFSNGKVVWENVEDGEPRHLDHVERVRLISLFTAVAAGDLATVEAQPWQPGYGG
jgi:hypothetical protein